MKSHTDSFGKTIQLFLVNGSTNGLMIATLHGWTGNLLVCKQAGFKELLSRSELQRTGIYILFAPKDSDNPLKSKVYIGESDSVHERIKDSAAKYGFWETAIAITTSDDALTKGHVRYLEARLIEIVKQTEKAVLTNTQKPDSGKKKLPEADIANMEAFLANLRVILPVVGIDILKYSSIKEKSFQSSLISAEQLDSSNVFEIRHKSGVKAEAEEYEGDFIVLKGSEALADTLYTHSSYSELKNELIEQGILKLTNQKDRYIFEKAYAFKSPSAASAVVLDRNSNGRWEWKLKNSKLTYHQWQEKQSMEK